MSEHIPPDAAVLSLQRTLEQMEDYVRKEPARAMAAAFGAGVLLKLLPSRWVATTLAAVTTRVLPPTLLGLGVLKAFELCCQRSVKPES